jgi:hypothetical protein
MSKDFNFDFDDIESNMDDDEIDPPPQEEKKEETLKKKKIEEKEPKNFPFKSNSDSKPIQAPTSNKNQKTIDSLTQKTKELNNSLETLDFNIEKFNRFSNNLKTFKIWNTVILSVSAFMIGIMACIFVVSMVQQNEKAKQIAELLEDYNVTVSRDKNILQIYTKKDFGELFKTPEYSVLEIKIKN